MALLLRGGRAALRINRRSQVSEGSRRACHNLKKFGSVSRAASDFSRANNQMADKESVVHNEKLNRFEMHFPDGEVALLEYGKRNGVVEMYHTETPPSQQGKGIAAKLADAASRWVVQENLKASLTCSYLRDKWLKAHPEFKSYLATKL